MPLHSDDSIDHDALARNVEKWLKTPLSGFVVGSAGGEEFYLSEDEKIASVRTVAQAHGGQRFVIGGIDNPSTTETLRLTERMAAAGAELIRVRIPKGGDVEGYFREVTANCARPIIVIHQTFNAGMFAAPPEVIGAVCSMDNVFGYIFDHNLRFESRVRRFIPEDRRFWTPNGTLLLPGALIGANGACMFFGNWGPAIAVEIMKLGIAGKFTEARVIQDKIIAVDYFGMTRGVAALKEGLNMLGYEGTVPRRPTLPLNDAEKKVLREALQEAGLLE